MIKINEFKGQRYRNGRRVMIMTQKKLDLLILFYPHVSNKYLGEKLGLTNTSIITWGVKKLRMTKSETRKKIYRSQAGSWKKCPIGTVIRRREGFRRGGADFYFIKVSENKTSKRNWKMLQTYIWEKAYGPVPKNHCVRFKDNNQLRCTLSNLYCVHDKVVRKENSGSSRLKDNWVAFLMAKSSIHTGRAEERKELWEEYLKHPKLVDLYRTTMILKKELKSNKV